MQAEGAQQRKAGDTEQKEAEAKGLVQGTIDQVTGYVSSRVHFYVYGADGKIGQICSWCYHW